MLEAMNEVRRSQGMNGGKQCPRCWQDIGLTTPMFLYLNHLECPHCELPLRYEEPLRFIMAKILILILFGGLLYVLTNNLPAGLQVLWWLVFLFAWAGLEAMAASVMRETGTLRPRH